MENRKRIHQRFRKDNRVVLESESTGCCYQWFQCGGEMLKDAMKLWSLEATTSNQLLYYLWKPFIEKRTAFGQTTRYQHRRIKMFQNSVDYKKRETRLSHRERERESCF